MRHRFFISIGFIYLSFSPCSFIFAEGIPNPISPNNVTVSTSTPTFTWGALPSVTGNATYGIRVMDSSGSWKVANAISGNQANCPDGTGICSVNISYFNASLDDGAAIWKVYESGGSDSEVLDFVVDTKSSNTELIIIPDGDSWESVGFNNPGTLNIITNITKLTGESLLGYFPGYSLDAPIKLKNKYPDSPIALHEKDNDGNWVISVNIDDSFWDQLVYQFGHEIMHVIDNHVKTPNNANQWFEEAISEAASLQALKDLPALWEANPPYSGGESYSQSIQTYFNKTLNEAHRQLQPGDTLSDWYQRESDSLRNDDYSTPVQRHKIEVVGTRLFNYFNADTARWQAVRYLNLGAAGGNISLEEYLNVWRSELPVNLKYVAETVSSWFFGAGGSICQANLGLAPDQWTMISLPCMPPSNKNTVQDIFGDDNLGTYGTHWVVFSYDNSSSPSAYKKETLSATLEQGKGYWFITTTENATLDMPEGSVQAPNLVSADSPACVSNKGCFEIPVAAKGSKPEWNLIGNPYLFPDTKLSELRIVTDIATSPNNCGDTDGCTLDEAKAAGIFYDNLWSWMYSGELGSGKYLTLTSTDALKPWSGAWATALENASGTNPRILVPNTAP